MILETVDFTTSAGFNTWQEKAKKWDERKLFVDEYTVHGMKGQVGGKFIQNENDESFARFAPKNPITDETNAKDPVVNDFRMTAELDTKIVPGMKIDFCYRITKGGHQSTNSIYLRDDNHPSGEFNGNDGHWLPALLETDGDWHVRTVEIDSMKVSGTLKGIRIPIPGMVSEFFDIKWVKIYT